jgi:hypothetical protein
MEHTGIHNVLLAVSIDSVGVGRLPQVLAAGGCHVTVVSGRGLAVTASRYVAKHIATGRSPSDVRQGLEQHVEQFPDLYPWVLIADEPLLRTFLSSPAAPALARLAPLTGNPLQLARILSKVSFTADVHDLRRTLQKSRVGLCEGASPSRAQLWMVERLPLAEARSLLLQHLCPDWSRCSPCWSNAR